MAGGWVSQLNLPDDCHASNPSEEEDLRCSILDNNHASIAVLPVSPQRIAGDSLDKHGWVCSDLHCPRFLLAFFFGGAGCIAVLRCSKKQIRRSNVRIVDL